jgi:hypothetical protein
MVSAQPQAGVECLAELGAAEVQPLGGALQRTLQLAHLVFELFFALTAPFQFLLQQRSRAAKRLLLIQAFTAGSTSSTSQRWLRHWTTQPDVGAWLVAGMAGFIAELPIAARVASWRGARPASLHLAEAFLQQYGRTGNRWPEN